MRSLFVSIWLGKLELDVCDIPRTVQFYPLSGNYTKTNRNAMALLGTIAGFSLFGLAARFGQLAIKKRNLMESACPHSPWRSLWLCNRHNTDTGFVNRPRRARIVDGRFWFCWILGIPVGRTCGGYACAEACGDYWAKRTEVGASCMTHLDFGQCGAEVSSWFLILFMMVVWFTAWRSCVVYAGYQPR